MLPIVCKYDVLFLNCHRKVQYISLLPVCFIDTLLCIISTINFTPIYKVLIYFYEVQYLQKLFGKENLL